MAEEKKEVMEVTAEQKQELRVANGINNIKEVLERKMKENVAAIPKEMNQQRFIMNCMAVVKGDINKWKNIKTGQIAEVFLKGCFLGLDFFNGECYAIPYGNTVSFQTDYKGELKLAKKYSSNPIKDIYAKVVRDGDSFEERIEDGRQTVSFNPIPFSDAEMIGAFAVVVFKDGSMLYETMSKKEIEGIRTGFSKAKDSPAWIKTPGEMYKKTVLRRLLKFVDLNFDTAEQDKAFVDGGDADFSNTVTDVTPVEVHNPFAEKAEQKEKVVEAEVIEESEQIGGLDLEEV